MKRRNSRNLSFNDMCQYADMREAIMEVRRLIKLTDNILVKNHLQAYSTKLWTNFCQWLDEEVEDDNL